MALSRAIETRKAPAQRICSDEFAERFLGGRYRWLLSARFLRDAGERLIEALFAGHHYYVIARTRYFDEVLKECLAGKPEQLVILGAGFDSRAYRFAGQLRDTAVFEVDHPATSQIKSSKIQGILGAAPANVVYVPVDFNLDHLPEQLRRKGYQDRRKTIFLWEGVTPYLTADAVSEVLRFVLSSGGSGSVVVFDYILKSVVEGSCSMPGALKEFEKMARTSEPLTFGIAEGESQAFLSRLGFCRIADVGSQELKDLYFSAQGEARNVKPWWRIVRATVP